MSINKPSLLSYRIKDYQDLQSGCYGPISEFDF